MAAGHKHTHTLLSEQHTVTQNTPVCETNTPAHQQDTDTDSRGPEMRPDGTWQSDMECLSVTDL